MSEERLVLNIDYSLHIRTLTRRRNRMVDFHLRQDQWLYFDSVELQHQTHKMLVCHSVNTNHRHQDHSHCRIAHTIDLYNYQFQNLRSTPNFHWSNSIEYHPTEYINQDYFLKEKMWLLLFGMNWMDCKNSINNDTSYYQLDWGKEPHPTDTLLGILKSSIFRS